MKRQNGDYQAPIIKEPDNPKEPIPNSKDGR